MLVFIMCCCARFHTDLKIAQPSRMVRVVGLLDLIGVRGNFQNSIFWHCVQDYEGNEEADDGEISSSIRPCRSKASGKELENNFYLLNPIDVFF